MSDLQMVELDALPVRNQNDFKGPLVSYECNRPHLHCIRNAVASAHQNSIDLADWMRGISADRRDATLARLRQMTKAVLSFASGAAIGATRTQLHV